MFGIFKNPSGTGPDDSYSPPTSPKPQKRTTNTNNNLVNLEDVKQNKEKQQASTSTSSIGAASSSSEQSTTKSKGWFGKMLQSFVSASSACSDDESPAMLPPPRRMPTRQNTPPSNPTTNTSTPANLAINNEWVLVDNNHPIDGETEAKIEEQEIVPNEEQSIELRTNSKVSQTLVLDYLNHPPENGILLLNHTLCESLFAGMTNSEKLSFLNECKELVQLKSQGGPGGYTKDPSKHFIRTNARDSVNMLVRYAADSVGYGERAAFLDQCQKDGLSLPGTVFPKDKKIKLSPNQQRDFIQYLKSLSKDNRRSFCYETAYHTVVATNFNTTEEFIRARDQSHWIDYIFSDPELTNEFCEHIFKHDRQGMQLKECNPFHVADRLASLVGLSDDANRKIDAYMQRNFSKNDLQEITACLVLYDAPRRVYDASESNSPATNTSGAIMIADNANKNILKNFINKVLGWNLFGNADKAKYSVRKVCDDESNLRRVLNCYNTIDEKLDCLSKMDKKLGGKVKNFNPFFVTGGDPMRAKNIVLLAYEVLEKDNAPQATINEKLKKYFDTIPPKPIGFFAAFRQEATSAPAEVPDFDTAIFGNKQKAIDLILPYMEAGKTTLSKEDLQRLAGELTPGAKSLKFLTNFYHPDKYSEAFNSINDPGIREKAEEFIKKVFQLVNTSREAVM